MPYIRGKSKTQMSGEKWAELNTLGPIQLPLGFPRPLLLLPLPSNKYQVRMLILQRHAQEKDPPPLVSSDLS